MPDISLCSNSEECSKRKTCYRATAIPDHWQSYIKFYEKNKECKVYWEVKPNKNFDKNGSKE